ncbi:MAG: hypothetical protein J5701_06145 [Bacteroidales bacterium]|nr:hypothetical protein [Bacteroidales bacterium]
MGQNKDNILLKYFLAKEEFKIDNDIMFPEESIQNINYRKIIHYDTAFSKLDTLFVVLPDNRKYEKQRADVVHTVGIPNLKKIYLHSNLLLRFMQSHGKNISKQTFVQSIPIKTDKKIVVLKCNWYTLVFEKKKGNKYELKNVDQEDFFDYVKKMKVSQNMDNNCNQLPLQNEKDKQ